MSFLMCPPVPSPAADHFLCLFICILASTSLARSFPRIAISLCSRIVTSAASWPASVILFETTASNNSSNSTCARFTSARGLETSPKVSWPQRSMLLLVSTTITVAKFGFQMPSLATVIMLRHRQFRKGPIPKGGNLEGPCDMRRSLRQHLRHPKA